MFQSADQLNGPGNALGDFAPFGYADATFSLFTEKSVSHSLLP